VENIRRTTLRLLGIEQTEVGRTKNVRIVATTFRIAPDRGLEKTIEDSHRQESTQSKGRFLIEADKDEMLSVKEAHTRYGIADKDLEQLAEKGLVEARRIEGEWAISNRSLVEHIQKSLHERYTSPKSNQATEGKGQDETK
jgi:predicted transcriptional regulator